MKQVHSKSFTKLIQTEEHHKILEILEKYSFSILDVDTFRRYFSTLEIYKNYPKIKIEQGLDEFLSGFEIDRSRILSNLHLKINKEPRDVHLKFLCNHFHFSKDFRFSSLFDPIKIKINLLLKSLVNTILIECVENRNLRSKFFNFLFTSQIKKH